MKHDALAIVPRSNRYLGLTVHDPHRCAQFYVEHFDFYFNRGLRGFHGYNVVRAMPPMKSLTKQAAGFLKRKRRPVRKPVVHALRFYDSEKLGFPLVEFRGEGQFQGINKGETVDGSCWPLINGHKRYAKIYRVTSVRHTIEVLSDGGIQHLKSVFVVPVV